VSAQSDQSGPTWEKDNLCGVCPYRKAVQAENERLRAQIERNCRFHQESETAMSDEIGRLRGVLSQAAADIAHEGYASWSRELHDELQLSAARLASDEGQP
jgi:hypothetical protein